MDKVQNQSEIFNLKIRYLLVIKKISKKPTIGSVLSLTDCIWSANPSAIGKVFKKSSHAALGFSDYNYSFILGSHRSRVVIERTA